MKKGFTLTERVIVMGLLSIIFGLVSTNLINNYRKPVQRDVLNLLTTDLRSQQIKAMTGKTQGGSRTAYGVHFETTSYTLFSGSSYNANDVNNFVVNLDPGYQFTNVTFPSSQIVFTQVSGDIVSYTAGNDNVSLTDTQNNSTQSLRINKYGATY